MTALKEILKQVDANQKPFVEQVFGLLERDHAVHTVDSLAKLSTKSLEAAFKTVLARNPFFDLDRRKSAALAQDILKAAKVVAAEDRKRLEKRRSRPAVALDDFAKVVDAPGAVKNAWKNAGVTLAADLFHPAAAKARLDLRIPLDKRRETLAVAKLTFASRNPKLSQALYKKGVTSLARLSRMPKKRLDAIMDEAKLDEDDRRDALEAYSRARWIHRQTQALAVDHGSARYHFGPAAAQPKADRNFNSFLSFSDLQQDPLSVTSSCSECSDCENAYSPLAYLVDLLDFINDQWQVTVDDLERILLQKIKDLVCEQAEAPTAQIRLAILVLEKFIGSPILRSDSRWQAAYHQKGDALVQLLSQQLQLDPPLSDRAALASDQRFAGNQQAQALVTALSSGSPALAELDAAEQALRTLVVAHIDAQYPLPQDPGANSSNDEMVAYFLADSRQKQSRDIARQAFEKDLARIIEATWVDYRGRLIEKTQKTARDLEDLLFIHFTAAPCHRTSPITQLILSLQAFVLAVRTGEIAQLKQTPRLGPIIGANDFSAFDERTWSWLETYSKWSSAMYAFLYPENLMGLPSLRTPISPTFTKAMDSLALSATTADVEGALHRLEKDLEEIGRLSLLSSHVVGDQLFVFARRDGSGGVWMNTVELPAGVSSGWALVIEGKENLQPFGVAPFYLFEEVRFIAGFLKSERLQHTAIQSVWITRDGFSETGPEPRQPDGFEHIGNLTYLELSREDDRLVTRLRWSAVVNGSSRKLSARLLPDGSGWFGGGGDSYPDVVNSPICLVGDTEFRAGAENENLHIRNVQTDAATLLPIAFDYTYGLGGTTRLATNPESMQTYVVASTVGYGPIAFSSIDLESMSLANDWRVLSIGRQAAETAYEEFRAGDNTTFPLVLRNLYFEERRLHFPLLAAWALNRSGDFAGAHEWLLSLYDPFTPDQPEAFPFSQCFGGLLDRPQDWLGEALNPHHIGRQRSGVYLRHVILAMVKNLLDWADHEFTLNHAESLNRAGELYRTAEQILQAPELGNPCQEGLTALEFEIGRRYGLSGQDIFTGLTNVARASNGKQTIDGLLHLVRSGKNLRSLKLDGQKSIDAALKPSSGKTVSNHLAARQATLEALEHSLLSKWASIGDDAAPGGMPFVGQWVAVLANNGTQKGIQLSISKAAAGYLRATLAGRPLAQLQIDPARNTISFRQPQTGISFAGKRQGGLIQGSFILPPSSRKVDATFNRNNLGLDLDVELDPVTVTLCIPPNPLLKAFARHAALGLQTLDKCRLISGEVRPATQTPSAGLEDSVTTVLSLIAPGIVDPLAVATDQPRYRYGYLVEQARQRAGLAKQLGDALLGVLKERDQAAYDLLLAKNTRELSSANRDLKDLVRTEARNAKTVAQVQLERAETNRDILKARIDGGLLPMEIEGLQALYKARKHSGYSAAFYAASSVWQSIMGAATAGVGGDPFAQFAALNSALASQASSEASELLTLAGFERRHEEWELQHALAEKDAQIADLQLTLAQDRINFSDKDYEIAGLQYTHTQRVFEFLQNKTLNKELYEWMVSVLIEQFRAVMQSATTLAQLAQRSLEFEWQAPVTIVKGDYWTVDAPSLREDQKGYGLLGAERLLTDLTRLDDFRLSVDKRRLQLAKTISLAQRFPADFVRLLRTGRIEFDTLMDWFDEDFPGHYLRLIKSVRVTVLALVPPIDGIHATLTNTGASTVVFPDRPPQRSLRTFGESIALDSPFSESGLFVLDYSDPMLLPFEGLGVETHWILDLPRPSNRFNFDTIADVLFTMEYTALHDEAYAERVRQRLGASRSVSSVLSLRTSFPDQWYHLQNPLDSAQAQAATLNIPRNLFPTNLRNLLLKHMTIILVPADSTGIQTLRSQLPQNAITVTLGGIGVSVSGNTIDPNSGSVTTALPGPGPAGNAGTAVYNDPTFDGRNVTPFGDWNVKIASGLYSTNGNNERILDLLGDILLVPTVQGQVG